jgi:alpha/beta hydrolase family protein
VGSRARVRRSTDATPTMPVLRPLFRVVLHVALCLLCSGALASAQVASEIRAVHRAGQTFVTWRELAAAGKRYRVYRSETAVRTAQDLKDADLLGEVDDRTSRNQGRSLASGLEQTWVIQPGGEPLEVSQGLFVYSAAEESERRAFYVVTVVQAGGENRTLVPGSNVLSFPVLERAAPHEPILQSDGPEGELWGHWVSDRDTPFQPALSPWPSRGFNFLFQRGTAPGPRGLVVRLHAAGQVYTQAWPQRFEVPQDVDSLALSDLMPYTSWSFWFGSHELMPGVPGAETRIWNYTQERMLWTLDWMVRRLGAEHDPERVYVVGGSMGAIGGMYLIGAAPGRFAAALLRNGLYDLESTDYRNPALFEHLFGSFSLDLLTREGLPILQRTNASFMAAHDLTADWPVVRTLNGRNDETVGWMSAVGLYAGLAAAGRPAVHYFDERTHDPNGYWEELERALLSRTFATRRDRPSLRFLECSLDDEAGDGTRTDGDAIGTINGYLDYDAETASASPSRLEFEVYLRDAGTLDDAPEPYGWARLMPWRTAPFRLGPGAPVRYTLADDGVLVDDHVLLADAHGRVCTPRVPLELGRRVARFDRMGMPSIGALFLGAVPIAGDEAQAVVRGVPGRSWVLTLQLGDVAGPYPASFPLHVRQGVLGANGISDVRFHVPRFVPAGTRIWARALVGTSLSTYHSSVVQAWAGSEPRHALPR